MASKMSSRLSCPSAQPDRAQARVIGVVSGTPEMPRIAYLKDEAVISASELPDVGGGSQ